VGVSDPGVRGESGRTCGPAGTWTFGAGCVIVGRVGFRLLLPNLRLSPRPWHSFDGEADPVDPVMAGPAVDPASVIADLHPASCWVERRDQMQVDRSGDSDQDDVTDLESGGIHGGNGDQFPAPDQRDHRGSRRAELHAGSAGDPAGYGVHSSHPGQDPGSPIPPSTVFTIERRLRAARSTRARPASSSSPLLQEPRQSGRGFTDPETSSNRPADVFCMENTLVLGLGGWQVRAGTQGIFPKWRVGRSEGRPGSAPAVCGGRLVRWVSSRRTGRRPGRRCFAGGGRWRGRRASRR
jgi:hypothetical protein